MLITSKESLFVNSQEVNLSKKNNHALWQVFSFIYASWIMKVKAKNSYFPDLSLK